MLELSTTDRVAGVVRDALLVYDGANSEPLYAIRKQGSSVFLVLDNGEHVEIEVLIHE